jgi:capsular exopolysaccharide synthesis family protein
MTNEKIRNLFDRILGADDSKAAPSGRASDVFGETGGHVPGGRAPAPAPLSRRIVTSRLLEQCKNVKNFVFSVDPQEFKGTQIPEEFGILKTNLLTLAEQKNIKSFVISSCHHGEGKTTTAVFLSAFLGLNRNRKVLLVDADLRRPKVKDFLNLRFEYGLEDVIENNVPVQNAIIYSVKDNFAVLPSHKGHSNAAELVESPRMAALPQEMEEHFDYIIYDTSPVLSTTDSAILGAYVGAIFLVVKAGSTQREAVTHAKSLLEQGGCALDGLILTQRRKYPPKYFQRYQYYRDSSSPPRSKPLEKPAVKEPSKAAPKAPSPAPASGGTDAPPSQNPEESGGQALSA